MKLRKFTLFHLSLRPIEQIDIETRVASREEWIRRIFAEQFEFPHRGQSQVHWVPIEKASDCILGLFQRTRLHQHHMDPSAGGAEVQSDEWQGAYVLIDPRAHDRGQRVAVENDVVGKPAALLRSFVAAVNQRPDRPFHVDIEPIWEGTRFWTFAAKHNFVLKSVTFDFVVPNMWSAESALTEDLRDTGEDTGADRVWVSLQSGTGIRSLSERVRSGVAYAEKGAGSVRAKALDGDDFSSDAKSKSTRVPFFKASQQMLVRSFLSLKDVIFGYEKSDSVDSSDPSGNTPRVD